MRAVGVACKGMLDFVEDCGLDVQEISSAGS